MTRRPDGHRSTATRSRLTWEGTPRLAPKRGDDRFDFGNAMNGRFDRLHLERSVRDQVAAWVGRTRTRKCHFE